jgi:hypothetical protein
MGNSLEATDRALEALDLLHDLLDGRELLRSVTNGVLLLSLNGELLRWVRASCHRIGRLWLCAGADKHHGASQWD